MYEEYSWREKRLHLFSSPLVACWINTKLTVLPQGNAHYSMYAIREWEAKQYIKLYTRLHKTYEHYSSELIIDAETQEAAEKVEAICRQNSWEYAMYDTGSGSSGAHFAIPREAEPSVHLYLRDLCFVQENFRGVADIDLGIYLPMHLIRGIGKTHEKTGRVKHYVGGYEGTVLPSVMTFSIPELLLRRHDKAQENYKTTVSSDWQKLQNNIIRHNPSGVKKGGRYQAIWRLAKDLYKCGLDGNTVLNIAAQFNSELENPSEDSNLNRACDDAYKAVCRDS